MKKSLVLGIILLVVCLSLTIYYEIRKNNFINIYEITSKGLKTEDKESYLEATYVAGSITSDSENGFYVMFGNGVQYIVYMDNNKANRISSYLLDNPDLSYRIEGVTKLIPKTLEEKGRKFVKEWLDFNHTHEETDEVHPHDITIEDFYQYFGYVYLDSTVNNYLLLKIFIYTFCVTGLTLIVSNVVKKLDLL